jgi:hypothetical protein
VRYVYKLYSRYDLVVEASPEWIRSVYKPRTCPVCSRYMPQEPCRALDVDLNSEYLSETNQSLRGPIIGIWEIETVIVRNDLAIALSLEQRGFCLGRVAISEEVCKDYCSLAAGSPLRIRVENDRVLERRPACAGCGREWSRVDFNAAFWVSATAVGNLDVFTCEYGKNLFVKDRVRSLIGEAALRELRLKRIELR